MDASMSPLKRRLVLDFRILQKLVAFTAELGGDVKDFKQKAPSVQFREIYGMTELTTIGALAINDLVKPGSCGVLMPNTEAKILDLTTGKAVGPNQTGEICFKGPQVMNGYLNNQKST